MMNSSPLLSSSAAFAAVCAALILSACASSGRPLRPRSDYDYIMPSELLRPTPVPAPVPGPVESTEEAAVEEDAETSGEKRSWFGGLFSRNKTQDEEDSSAAVGETGTVESLSAAEIEEAEAQEAQEVNPIQLSENRYNLKVGDTVYITLSGSGGLNEQIETVIDEQGNVKLRFIGAVRAKGRTPTELEDEIEAEYTGRQKIYKEVVARVVVPNTFYFIGGEVRQPGRFPLVGRVSLSQAIVSAGNFTEWANSKRIILVRDNERIELNFRDIKENPNLDVELQPGDVITVERSFL